VSACCFFWTFSLSERESDLAIRVTIFQTVAGLIAAANDSALPDDDDTCSPYMAARETIRQMCAAIPPEIGWALADLLLRSDAAACGEVAIALLAQLCEDLLESPIIERPLPVRTRQN
jgi:hypothetical protein